MRPLGVTLIGFYQLLRGVLGVLFGLSILAFTNFAARMVSLAAESTAIGGWLHRFGNVAGLVIIVFGLLLLIAGYGVLGMQNWGRLLTILLSAIGLFLLLPGLAGRQIFSVVFGFVNGISIIYLAMPPIKRAFQAHGNPMRMPA